MNIEEFKDKVDLYSADLSRWPVEMVKDAHAFMQENTVAAAYFERALALDEKLHSYAPEEPRLPELEARIMAAIAEEKRDDVPAAATIAATQATFKWRAAWLFAPAGGLLAAALLGFFMGFSPQQQASFMPLDPAYAAEEQLNATYDSYEGEIF